MTNKPNNNLKTLADWRGLLTTIEHAMQGFSAKQAAAAMACAARENALTKPAGSLGRLEDLSQWFYKTRGVYDNISSEKLLSTILVFAGNHGVAVDGGVSAFPPIVTAMMVKNFNDGGAAINQMARWTNAKLNVISMNDLQPTNNFATMTEPTPAMTEEKFCQALKTGFDAVDKNTHLVVLGEMGIGNSTAASAICHCLYGGDVAHWVGRGTGINDETLAHKQSAVAQGVAQYQKLFAGKKGLETLQFFGGFEMAGIMGAIIAGLYHHIPIILDSYVTVATFACLTSCFNDSTHVLAGVMTPHCPQGWHDKAAEKNTAYQDAYHGHAMLLKQLGKEPLVDLGLRLGEGTGGVVALQILRGALQCHHGMATFADAGVAEKTN
ncbi:MAG: nicotinate-nucleotide--dimethylbenzimidazole phosphoribosyltransferase [Hydrotalea sp.]|nr:nicotinate-nucleotide--dimethylbenzimidazole phosphoribosyltransferase [Hydrotalea sp.]